MFFKPFLFTKLLLSVIWVIFLHAKILLLYYAVVHMYKNFYSFILKSEIRGYKRTFASQFWIFWACFVYFFLISPGNTFEKRQQKQRLAFFSKLCWDENHNIKPDLIAKSQNIPLFIKKNTAKMKQLFKSDYNINEKKFLY